ncbi:hypothetical protein Acr_08g0012420 [Actinidia rufa]|uniref:Reverse transcriptase domain-containing protein n=1 Tax=Actinidia rufa TaxID=165716 RepID=A0A7J0F362_9ERIC|nr:hypothetical protein Acr_08g0012420 [Actinidia rufa]
MGEESSSPPTISVKHVEIDGRSIAVINRNETAGSEADNEGPEDMNDPLEHGSEGEGSEMQSEAESQTLGDENYLSSLGARQNAQPKTGSHCEPSAAAEDKTKGNATQGTMKKPWASLFASNRLPSNGSKLEFFNLEDGPIKLGEEDIQGSNYPWERCLVGYFGGRFPGKQALNQIVASWKVLPSIKFHGSGWIIFQFCSQEDQTKVLENGPYIIYGSPLLLKPMPKFFRFGKEAISCFPVWVQLRSVPMILWNPMVFGKICSKIGRPLHMDKLTAQRERITYARCLVEVDMAKDLVHSVSLQLPDGEDYEQNIYYENLPRFCPLCRVVGHTMESCKKKPATPKPTESKDSEGLEANTNTSAGSGEGKKTQQEWQIKQAKAPTGKAGDMELSKSLEASNPPPTIPEVPEPEKSLSVHLEPNSEHLVNEKEKTDIQLASQEPLRNQVESSSKHPVNERGEMDIEKASQESSGKQVQMGREIYIQQAIQVASGELKSKLQQMASKSHIGNTPSSGLKKGTSPHCKKTDSSGQSPKQSSLFKLQPFPSKRRGRKDKKGQRKPSQEWEPYITGRILRGHGGRLPQPPHCLMIISFWNIRGLNMPLKQNGILTHLRKNRVAIMGILETKLSHQALDRIAKNKFKCWKMADNFSHHPNGRIMIIWKEDLVHLEIEEVSDQIIHCLVTCKSSATTFYISFVYAFNSIAGRRPLWDSLRRYNSQTPWMLLGDFNNVLSPEERINGSPVSMHEIRDFKACCYDLGLSDLRSSGAFHTWTNNSVWCKLDRAMVNNAWFQKGLTAQAIFDFPGKFSDHSPCIVTLFGENDRGASPFKFFNMWVNHESFQDLVRNSWEMQDEGTAMFRICKKLKALKGPLKTLNKVHFSHISARAEAAEEELLQAQQKLHDNAANQQLQSEIPELRSKSLKLANAEMSFCSQLAKAKFLKNSDKGTKFFHNLIKSQCAKSHISSISLEDGTRSSSHLQVSEAFVKYYTELLGSKGVCTRLNKDIVSKGRCLDHDQAASLIQAVTEEDIKNALFSIGEDKAPGPDGFSSCFFKKAWGTVGRDFSEAILEFFSSGKILKQINHSALALIPKSKNADRVEDFRPIACCNVIYKVISKIMVSRLAPALLSIIDPAQAAFIQNRRMVDNIYLLQELLRQYGRKRSSPRCILNIDIRKAFDTVDWDFIHDMLQALNFPPVFISWTMTCISSTSFSLAYNGSLHGLKISLSKSSFFSAGISDMDLEIIKDITGFPQGSFPFKYLGIPVAASRLSIAQYSPLIDRISDSISAWAGATLSYAGRTELIRSVLQGVECYWLSILPIPAGVKAKIVQLCRNFLWSGKCTTSKKTPGGMEGCQPSKVRGRIRHLELQKPGTKPCSPELYGISKRRKTLFGSNGSTKSI